MAKLVCQAGPSAGHEYPLKGEKVLFGRQSTCDVQILDSMASREHFIVRKDGTLFTLVDLESRNGTYLNDRKVSERQLEFGDVIRIGKVEYLLVREPGDTDIKDLLTDKYKILEKIGEGGMGIVYKAVQKSMDREVALKVLAPKFSSRPRFIEQFVREARAAGALNHPNIIQVHDVGTENNLHYFSMEYVDGPTCMAMLRAQGPMPATAALEVIRQTAKALEYAHANRIIHRDIKPDNIMVGANNTVKLADLGISKTFDEAEAEGNPKRIVGTPHYMAPEAALGKPIDHRIDIYSLGATLFHLLSGKTPYGGDSANLVLKAHVKDPPPEIPDHLPPIPDPVRELMHKLMAKKPEDRHQNATEVMEEAQAIIGTISNGGSEKTGQETILLRRLAAETSRRMQAADVTNVTTGGNETNPPSTGEGTQPPNRTAGAQSDAHTMKVLSKVLMVVVFGLALILAWQVFKAVRQQLDSQLADSSTPITDSADNQQNVVDTPNADPTPIDDPSPTPTTTLAEIRQQFSDLEQRADNETDPTELANIIDAIDDLRPQTSNIELLGSMDRLTILLQERIRPHLQEVARQRFDVIERDVLALLADHNFEAASARLEAVDTSGDTTIAGRVLQLQSRVQRDQAEFIRDIGSRVKSNTRAENLDELRKIYADLPPSLLEHQVAQDLQEAIRSIENKLLKVEKSIIKAMSDKLTAWDLAGFDGTQKPVTEFTLESSQNRAKDLHQLRQDLSTFVTRVDSAIKGFRTPPKHVGRLQGMENPTLIGATNVGIEVSFRAGGKANIAWRLMDETVLKEVLVSTRLSREADLQKTIQDWVKLAGE